MSIGPSDSPPPLVSIGLPVFNGAKSVSHAIESLLAQTHANFELIVSDNASTDETAEICERYERTDSRLRLVRHASNQGAAANFHHVLQLARGDFFLWAAHDDRWRPEFVEANLRVLSTRPDVVLSVSKVAIVPATLRRMMNPGTFPLMGSVRQNVRRYLRRPGYNSRFYGVMRTAAIRQAFSIRDAEIYGGDWLVMVRLLEHGKMYELDEVLFERAIPAHSPASFERFFRKVLGLEQAPLFPLAEFSRRTLSLPHVPRDPSTYASLGFYNLALLPYALRSRYLQTKKG